jgi:hypothetical protein
VPRERGAVAGGEQAEPVRQADGKVGETERPQSGRRQFQGKRQTVEGPNDP